MNVGDVISIEGKQFRLGVPIVVEEQPKQEVIVEKEFEKPKIIKKKLNLFQKKLEVPEKIENEVENDILKDIVKISEKKNFQKKPFSFPIVDVSVFMVLGIIVGAMLMYLWIKTNGFLV